MIGTLVNVAAVLMGSLIGLLIRRGLPERMKDALMRSCFVKGRFILFLQ